MCSKRTLYKNFEIQLVCLWVFDRFILEQLVLDRYMRYVLIVYPVVIWALSGNMTKNFDANSPNGNGIFIGKCKLERHLIALAILKEFLSSFLLAGLLAIASVLFIVRIGLVVWRHFKQPLYKDVSAEAMELTEIAAKQKKMYR